MNRHEKLYGTCLILASLEGMYLDDIGIKLFHNSREPLLEHHGMMIAENRRFKTMGMPWLRLYAEECGEEE